MAFFKISSICALIALTLAPPATAHSWVEEYQVIDPNGTYIGDRGYSRGYVARTDPGFNGFSDNYLLPSVNTRINSSDLLCHPSQRTSNYTNPAYPKLQVTPGSYVAMKYLENGHVTLPWNQLGKPVAGGTVFVYGTTQPSNEEKIVDVLAWTPDGKGGDGRGFLMTAQNFDDGRCHQINCGNISVDRQVMFADHVEGQSTSSIEQWCETDLQIPASQAPGTLTVYWVWQWPTDPNHDCTYPEGKDEYYTTCSDFEVVAASGNNSVAKILKETGTHTVVQENPQTTAVSNFKSRLAYTTSPAVYMLNGTSTVGPMTTVDSSFASGCSAHGNTKPAVTVPANCPAISVFTGAQYASASDAIKADVTTAPITNAPVEPTNTDVPIKPTESSVPPAKGSVTTMTTVVVITQSAPLSTGNPTTQTASSVVNPIPSAGTTGGSTHIAASSPTAGSSVAVPSAHSVSATAVATASPTSLRPNANPDAREPSVAFPTIATINARDAVAAPSAHTLSGRGPEDIIEEIARDEVEQHPRRSRYHARHFR